MTTATAASRSRARGLWLAFHLYLGLGVGGVFALAGLTGSALVFYLEIDALLNPHTRVSAPAHAVPLAYERIVQSLRASEPERPGAWRLELPRAADQAITARYYKPAETRERLFAPLLIAVDPYTGAVLERRFWGSFLMTWLYDLHYTLLLEQTGKWLMAVVGLVLTASLVSGLVLWWPTSPKALRKSLSFKFNASGERRVFDLHKLAGVYGSIVLLVLALTGVALEVPDIVNPLLARVWPVAQKLTPVSVLPPPTRVAAIDADRAVAIARNLFPDAELRWIETPADANGTYRLNFRKPNEPSRRFPKTNVWIDRYSGRVLAVEDPDAAMAGDRLLHWFHPLHSGEAFDLPGRLAVLVSGLLCPLLYATGFIRWRHKRRARRLKSRR